jgi:hypothetical protein
LKLEAGRGLVLHAPADQPWTIAWGCDDWFGPLDVLAGGKALGGPGERFEITGWSARPPRALAPTGGRPLQVRYEGGLFRIPVSLEDRGWLRVEIDADFG